MLAIFTFYSLDPRVHELSEMATKKGVSDRLRDIYSIVSPAKNYIKVFIYLSQHYL